MTDSKCIQYLDGALQGLEHAKKQAENDDNLGTAMMIEGEAQDVRELISRVENIHADDS